ncbi:MAG: PhzF family phenazine biosynthesis protein, partial [Rhodothermales bacterium]|nr:PhzF family phenazine biosynthesis protein [Rhodothermales bacterium]
MRLYQVDSFTDVPFTGNPAGFCLLDEWPSDAWLQNVAAEMNLAETAFLVQEDETFHLRWFTPTVEVDLCGHATLSSAHILWETRSSPSDKTITFRTRSGVLSARREDGWIVLDFPREKASAAVIPGLEEALGIPVQWSGRNRMDVLAVVTDEACVVYLHPNQSLL